MWLLPFTVFFCFLLITFMLYPSEIPLRFLLNAVLSPHFPLFFWCAMKGLGHSAHLKDYNHDPIFTRQQLTEDYHNPPEDPSPN